MSIETNAARFHELCGKIHRDGIEDLIAYLDRSDFFRAPASTRYHLASPGGLCEHSLHVYDQYNKLNSVYHFDVSEESVAIMTLFHDLCKVNFYKPETRNRKNAAGQWESYESYAIEEKFPFAGHGSKSVFIVQQYIKLTPEEAVAINCHMSLGGDNGKYVGDAFEAFPAAWLLSVADQAAAWIDEAHE